jgi:hypothetical protein
VQRFLQRFALLVAGTLSGFARLVFKGKLCALYSPNGMNCLLQANHVPHKDFKRYAAEVTARVVKAAGVPEAKERGIYRYLNSSRIDKEEVARQFVRRGQTGLVCVLQCVEPCWTFDWVTTPDGTSNVRGEPGKCSHLYHYYVHPSFGWLYVRLQTWFPFEIQIGVNGREWLAGQMDREKLRYARHDNKFLWVRDWQRAQQLLDEQAQTDWQRALDALQQQVHPLHPEHLGRLPVKYNWTAFQSEWATDIAFRRQEELEPWFKLWLRQAMLNYDHSDILGFFGHAPALYRKGRTRIETSVHAYFEGKRIKHWVGNNSLKLYHEANVLRAETTLNDAGSIFVMRPPADDPMGEVARRRMRPSVADLAQRAVFCQAVNERYVEALASTAETHTVRELAEPLTRRMAEPSKSRPSDSDSRSNANSAVRYVRGLNPLAEEDAALLTAISDPQWMTHGLRNRDLVAALYPEEGTDPSERRRRSARVTRLLRLLRGHGLLEKIDGTHPYQVSVEGRRQLQALLACRNANPEKLMANAA